MNEEDVQMRRDETVAGLRAQLLDQTARITFLERALGFYQGRVHDLEDSRERATELLLSNEMLEGAAVFWQNRYYELRGATHRKLRTEHEETVRRLEAQIDRQARRIMELESTTFPLQPKEGNDE